MSARRGVLAAGTGMIARGSNQLAMIAVTLVATRHLGPAEFGVFALASAFVTLTRTLLYCGPFEILMKARSVEDCAAECLAINVLLAVATGVAVAGVAAAAPYLFGTAAVGVLLIQLFPTTIVGAFSAWLESQVLRQSRIRTYYILTTIVEIASAACAVALLAGGWGLLALVAQLYARQIGLTVAYAGIVRLPRRWRPRLTGCREVLGWSLPRFGSTVVTFLSNYGSDIVLGAVLSPAAAGLYRASNRVVTAVADVFVQPVRTLATAAFSRRFAARAAVDGHWLRMFAGVAFMGWSVLACVALLADRIAPLALGRQWAATAPLIAILCFARALGILNAVTSSLLVANDRQRQVFYVQSAGAAAAILFAIVLAPFGVGWATIGSAAAAVLNNLLLTMLIVRLGGTTRADVAEAALVIGVPVAATLVAAVIGRFAASWLFGSGIAPLVAALLVCGCGWAAGVLVQRGRIVRAVAALGG